MSPEIYQLPLPMPEHELTGLPNREALQSEVERLAHTAPGKFALVAIDLDGLKAINDEMGHPEGDAYLVNAADILNTIVRRREENRSNKRQRPSVSQHDVLGYGLATHASGDEFWLILDIEADEDVAQAITRIQNALDEYGIGASMGGRVHRPGESVQDLFEHADQLMYRNKAQRLLERYDISQLRAIVQIGRIAVENGINLRDAQGVLAALGALAAGDLEDPAFLAASPELLEQLPLLLGEPGGRIDDDGDDVSATRPAL